MVQKIQDGHLSGDWLRRAGVKADGLPARNILSRSAIFCTGLLSQPCIEAAIKWLYWGEIQPLPCYDAIKRRGFPVEHS